MKKEGRRRYVKEGRRRRRYNTRAACSEVKLQFTIIRRKKDPAREGLATPLHFKLGLPQTNPRGVKAANANFCSYVDFAYMLTSSLAKQSYYCRLGTIIIIRDS